MIATSDIEEIAGGIRHAIYQQTPVFILELEEYDASGDWRKYLAKEAVEYLNKEVIVAGFSRRLDDSLRELTLAIDRRLKPQITGRARFTNSGNGSAETARLSGSHVIAAPLPDPPVEAPRTPIRIPENGALVDAKPLRGFFCYSREDDSLSHRALSTLRERIEEQLRLQLGRRIEVWQDLFSIDRGKRWKEEIRRGIERSVFFIPIVTPHFLVSPNCADEFKLFCQQEKALGRSSLVFPIKFVEISGLKPQSSEEEELRNLVVERQCDDYTRLRETPFDDWSVKRWIREFCEGVVKALLAEAT